MVELVDTRDLKSRDQIGRAGSSPAPGTQKTLQVFSYLQGFEANGLVNGDGLFSFNLSFG